MCQCCVGRPSPEAFGIYLTSTDYPLLDGLEINMELVNPPPDCLWIETSEPFEGALLVQIEDWDRASGLPLALIINWIGSPYGDLELVHYITTTEFTCNPWHFLFTATTTIDGVPTTSTITIESGPSIERVIAGYSLGGEIVDAPSVETLDAGIEIGAEIEPDSGFAGYAIGAEIIDAEPPIENLVAGYSIGGATTD